MRYEFQSNLQELTQRNVDLRHSILQSCKKDIYRKNEFFLRAGDLTDRLAFVEEGSFRVFYRNESLEEFTVDFCVQGELLLEVESFYQKKPSEVFIQALEKSKVRLITRDQLYRLYGESPIIQKLGRNLTHDMLLRSKRRVEKMVMFSPEERYLDVLLNAPELVERVPLKFLASYLGVTPQSLSRIRSRLARKKC